MRFELWPTPFHLDLSDIGMKGSGSELHHFNVTKKDMLFCCKDLQIGCEIRALKFGNALNND